MHSIYKTILGIVAMTASAAHAVNLYQDGDKFVEIGGRIQLQYQMIDPDVNDNTDQIYFRRLRPFIKGSLYKDWEGKLEWDMGKAKDDNEVSIKDAYLQYKGFKNTKVTLGNYTFPFSREQMTSSKEQQLVERTFVGDHDYGSVARQTGVFVDGHNDDKTFNWSAAIAQADIDPDNKFLDFDSSINRNSDFNEGWMLGGRLDFGGVKNSQTNFSRENQFGWAVAAFSWSNDDDNNIASISKTPVDTINGLELSTALRHGALSVDLQYNAFNAELVTKPAVGAPSSIRGIYAANGKTTLETVALEGGVLLSETGEVVAGVQTLKADGLAETWNRTTVGYNWYLHKHDVKVQFNYQMGKNVEGEKDKDENQFIIQAQFVF